MNVEPDLIIPQMARLQGMKERLLSVSYFKRLSMTVGLSLL